MFNDEILKVSQHITEHSDTTAHIQNLSLTYTDRLEVFIYYSSGQYSTITITDALPIAERIFTTAGIYSQPQRWRYHDDLLEAVRAGRAPELSR